MEPVTFATADGVQLEGELRRDVPRPVASAAICHPHPRHGGSKDHPLLWAIRNELAHRGFAVLAFNFRGVMGSQGSYGGGIDEVEDARAAVGRVGAEAPDAPMLLAGWSFGASVALRESLADERVDALALVGIPLVHEDIELPELPSAEHLRSLGERSALLLAGERDRYCPPAALRDFGAGFPRADVVVVPGADHYFTRREREAAAIVGESAERLLGLA